MQRVTTLFVTFFAFMGFALAIPSRTMAQEAEPTATNPDLVLFTTYPDQVIELGESVTIKLRLNAVGESQTVQMMMDEIPEGWSATFRGGGTIINAVYVSADSTESVDLRLDPPEDVASGKHEFVVLAQGEDRSAALSLTLTYQEKVPASLDFSIDLPTIKGSPTTTFRYNATLQNNGDQELMVNLTADTPNGFLSKFSVSGQDVTSFPLGADQSKSVSIQLDPIVEMPAGSYPFRVYATGGELEAVLNLAAEVIGQGELELAGLDGRLSGKANAGVETTLPVVVRNTGTAAAQGVELSATAPSGWTVSFNPEVIPEIPAGEQVEATAILVPAEKAVAGDYMVTMRAKPIDSTTASADFRITVTTSTLWGIAGIALIAVAVGVVALAVMRFGRR